MRKPIEIGESVTEVIVKMSEGVIGAVSVLTQMIDSLDPESLMRIMALDDMNMRGSQIWVGYKDHCGEDLEVFKKAIDDRDQGMIDTVNKECYHPELPQLDAYQHKAVTSGASFDHVADQDPDHRGVRI